MPTLPETGSKGNLRDEEPVYSRLSGLGYPAGLAGLARYGG
jgi:hypothetical protein